MRSVRHTISAKQLRRLQLMAILPTTVVFLPGQAFAQAGSGALWALALATGGGLAINWSVAALMAGHGPHHVFQKALGRSGGQVLSGFYGLALAVACISIWNELLSFVQASVLPRTPGWAVGALVLGAAVALAYGRAEGLARVSDLLTMTGLGFSAILILPTLGFIRPTNYLPWWPNRWASVWSAAALPLSFLGESVVGVSFLDYCREDRPARLTRAVVEGALGASAVLLATTIVVWGVLGVGYARLATYPVLETIRLVRAGQFLSRLDLIFVPVWLGLIELKLAIWLFAASDALRRAWRRRWHAAWPLATGGLTLALALVAFPSVPSRIGFIATSWTFSLFPALVGVLAGAGARMRLSPRVR
ncbi:MAG: spore germination protein [Firmicutes bacterium]|nr:GerAB/ArcD/ProY family transporter [Alicyclobacillaceae bacterium]MCL6497279.1 spore germination protein [Bacillota bacterium]